MTTQDIPKPDCEKAHSTAAGDILYDEFGLMPTVIYNGVSLPNRGGTAAERNHLRRELGLQPNEAVVGIVGRLQDFKGHDVFLHAAREVVKICTKVKFVVVGSPGNFVSNQQYAQRLMELTDRLGLQDRVIFTGFRNDVHDIMTLFDLLVLASHHAIPGEGLPNVILEALACKTRIVATRVGAIPDFVSSKEQGIIVEPANAQEIANAIKEMLGENDFKNEKASNTHILSWKENAKQFREVLEV